MNHLQDLDKKAIKSLETHLKTGYEKDELKVRAIIQAIKLGKIGIKREQDDYATFENCCGDIFKPEVNTDIEPSELKRQERNLRKRFNNAGCWTMVTRYWTGRGWEESEGLTKNVIGGFVGYDFFGSGYEMQMFEDALEAYNRQELDEDGFVFDPFKYAI